MKILFCQCTNSDVINNAVKLPVTALLDKQPHVIAVSDLCNSIARRDINLMDWAQSEIIVACFPRAVKSLFQAAGLVLNETARFFNMREDSIETLREMLTTLSDSRSRSMSSESRVSSPELSDWPSWFPVIDRTRCKNCKQCLSFCLFGTYALDDQEQVVVQNPTHCKNLCPACARICPEAAIIFPKVAESPINGDEITDEDALRKTIRVNVDEILGDDVYAALAERRRKAKTLRLRREAEEVRKRFLDE